MIFRKSYFSVFRRIKGSQGRIDKQIQPKGRSKPLTAVYFVPRLCLRKDLAFSVSVSVYPKRAEEHGRCQGHGELGAQGWTGWARGAPGEPRAGSRRCRPCSLRQLHLARSAPGRWEPQENTNLFVQSGGTVCVCLPHASGGCCAVMEGARASLWMGQGWSLRRCFWCAQLLLLGLPGAGKSYSSPSEVQCHPALQTPLYWPQQQHGGLLKGIVSAMP